jgi:hypothetical protein
MLNGGAAPAQRVTTGAVVFESRFANKNRFVRVPSVATERWLVFPGRGAVPRRRGVGQTRKRVCFELRGADNPRLKVFRRFQHNPPAMVSHGAPTL